MAVLGSSWISNECLLLVSNNTGKKYVVLDFRGSKTPVEGVDAAET